MQRFKAILFVVTPEMFSQVALKRAVKLANNNQARLNIVEVIDEIPDHINLSDRVLSSKELQASIVKEHTKRLQQWVAPWVKNIEIKTKVLYGISFLEITREVLRSGYDLVIKTAERGGLLDRIFGSDDMHLLRKCPCPVWLFKSKSPKQFQRILAAVDVGDYYPQRELNARHILNIQTLEMASSLAFSESAEFHIISVWDAIGEGVMRSSSTRIKEEKIADYVEQLRQQHKKSFKLLIDEVSSNLASNGMDYLKPENHLIKGLPREEIPSLAKVIEADLVVMGTVARTGISGFFMGNTAETILNQLDCSVLTIKPPGFQTPITLED